LTLKNKISIFPNYNIKAVQYLQTFKTEIIMSVNKAILIGNVGKDPEIRHLENGTPVCTLTLATSESYTNKSGEKVTSTDWHNIVLWRGLAEIANKYVKKGSQIYVEGRIKSRSYDDKEGNKKYITEIVADTMQLLGRKPDDGSAASSNQAPVQETKTTQETDVYTQSATGADDLPF
jgi:single-strand DNA-binding protein